MPNPFMAGLMALIILGPWWSTAYVDADTDEHEKPETEPETESDTPVTSQVPSSIVFVPHEFGAPEVTEAGGVRGASQAAIQLLAPRTLSRTLSAAPTFYWHVDQAVGEHRFTLIEENTIEPLLEITLEPTKEGGINSLSLANHDVRLNDPGLYRWSIAANLDQEPIAAETVAQTLFVYDENFAAPNIDAPLAQRAEFLAENGYWYDLLDLISRQSEASGAHRQDWLALRADLLDQVGLMLPSN